MAKKDEEFQRPILTVDVVLFTLLDGRLHVLLDKRDKALFLGQPALIGGYIHPQEDADMHAAAQRVCKQKLGMKVAHLEQLAMFSGAERDPRGWSATMAYIAMIRPDNLKSHLLLEKFFPVDSLPRHIAFDHHIIIKWAVNRVRNKASYSSLPLFLMPPRFTLSQLQMVYEALMATPIDRSNFRRKIMEQEIVIGTGEMSDPKVTNTRPAELFRPADSELWLFDEVVN